MFETMFVVVMGLIVAIGIGGEIVYRTQDKIKALALSVLVGMGVGGVCSVLITHINDVQREKTEGDGYVEYERNPKHSDL